MNPPTPVRAVLFDIGDTLVRAAAPGTPVERLQVDPIGDVARELEALARHVRVGAVTDTATMSADHVRAALAGSGIGEQLEVIVTSSDIGAPKPDPRGLVEALRRFAVEPAAALFVGDAEVDRGAAAAAGVGFVPAGGDRSAVQAVLDHLCARDPGLAAAVTATLTGPN